MRAQCCSDMEFSTIAGCGVLGGGAKVGANCFLRLLFILRVRPGRERPLTFVTPTLLTIVNEFEYIYIRPPGLCLTNLNMYKYIRMSRPLGLCLTFGMRPGRSRPLMLLWLS